MHWMFAMAVASVVGYLAYRSGKRTGSRKGYSVGRSHGRRWRR
jgi:hypothetical protein